MQRYWIPLVIIGLSFLPIQGQVQVEEDQRQNEHLRQLSPATTSADLVTECRQELNAERPSQITGQAQTDVQTLTRLGPRVTGSTNLREARDYLISAYQAAGYQTEIQAFRYLQTVPQTASLSWDAQDIKGNALGGSASGKVTAPIVIVPGVGQADEFAEVNVEGAIALVMRGEINFSDKVDNAIAAGALGLIVMNSSSGALYGDLTSPTTIPVLGISGTDGAVLRQQAGQQRLVVDLVVQLQERFVTGYNVIAHVEGVTQPDLVVGGHYDSVSGSPGANDNASGTAVVLNLARSLAATPAAEHIWFVAFDGEEDGLLGSQAFVTKLQTQMQDDPAAMVNFDMVGLNKSLAVTGDDKLLPIATAVKAVTDTFEDGGDSDHASFIEANIPALFFTRGLDKDYHSPQDDAVDAQRLDEALCVGLEVIDSILLREI